MNLAMRNERNASRVCRRSRLVARRGDLPDLSALLPGSATATASAISPASASGCRYVAELGVDAIWISPFFNSPMKDFGYDVSDYRDVDPMFGTLDDFDALIDDAHRARPEGDDRPGALAHLRPASLVHGKPVEPRQRARPTGMSGPIPSPTARRPTTGCRSSAARPGSGIPAGAAVLLAQFPGRAARPQLPQSGGAGRAARRHAVLAGARRRRLPPRHHQLLFPLRRAARQSAAAGRRPQRLRSRPTVNPYNFQDHLYDKSQPENLDFLQAVSARCSTISGRRRSRRGRRCAARAGDRGGNTPPAATRCTCAIPSISCRPNGSTRDIGALGHLQASMARRRTAGRAGPFPITTSMRHASRWGCLTPSMRCSLSQADGGAADVPARLGLHLPGRGAGLARGRTRLRGSAGSLRHPLLAEVQGPRRLPHADGVGRRTCPMAASAARKPWLPVPGGASCRRCQRAGRTMQPAFWNSIAPSCAFAAANRRWSRAT